MSWIKELFGRKPTVVQRVYLPDFNPTYKPVVLVLYSDKSVKWERPPL